MDDILKIYRDLICPKIFQSLDSIFPEFGWKKKGSGWIAINNEYCHQKYKVRAERIVCSQNSGFLIHGDRSVSWISYVTNITNPKGKDWFDGYKKLANLCGFQIINNDKKINDPLNKLYELFYNLCKEKLHKNNDILLSVVNKLQIEKEKLLNLEIGFFDSIEIKNKIYESFSEDLILKSKIFFDTRWNQRVIGPWRDNSDNIINFWTRKLDDSNNEEKYLYKKEGKKTIPFGLHNIKYKTESLLIVEGIRDYFRLQINDFKDCVALGGASLSNDFILEIKKKGINEVVLCFDYDQKNNEDDFVGMTSLIKAIEKLITTDLKITFIHPKSLAITINKKEDPDSFIFKKGIEKFNEIHKNREDGIDFYIKNILLNNKNSILDFIRSSNKAQNEILINYLR